MELNSYFRETLSASLSAQQAVGYSPSRTKIRKTPVSIIWQNNDGETPLDIANRKGVINIVKLLEKKAKEKNVL